jgi:hypothetical protein
MRVVRSPTREAGSRPERIQRQIVTRLTPRSAAACETL